MNDTMKKKNKFMVYAISIFIVLLAAFDIFAAFRWGNANVLDTLSAVFFISGLYGVATNLFLRNKALEAFRSNLDHMLSPNPAKYTLGNFLFAAFLPAIAAVALSPRRRRGSPLGLVSGIIWLPISIILFIYVIFHTLVIAPIAYLAVLVASIIVDGIVSSAEDVAISRGTLSVSIRDICAKNQTAAKSFVVAVPSLALGAIGKLLGLFVHS